MAKTIPFVQKGPKADSKDGKIVEVFLFSGDQEAEDAFWK
jgi:hypothetical protein